MSLDDVRHNRFVILTCVKLLAITGLNDNTVYFTFKDAGVLGLLLSYVNMIKSVKMQSDKRYLEERIGQIYG